MSEDEVKTPPKKNATARKVIIAIGIVEAAITLALAGPHILRHMSFFRVHAIEIQGARYTDPAEIAGRLHLDTTASVWDDVAPYEKRVLGIPELRGVEVRRKMPSTLVVEVTEREPVALAPNEAGQNGNGEALVAYDASGAVLPIDVTRADVDAPVLARPDLSALRLLHALQADDPRTYGRVSAVRRDGAGDFIFSMPPYTVRVASDAQVQRFAELDPVTADLARRHITPLEIDLRFRDQVVVRR